MQAELEGVPEVSFVVSSKERTESWTSHPCVEHSESATTTERKLRFSPPLNTFDLCHYKVRSVEPQKKKERKKEKEEEETVSAIYCPNPMLLLFFFKKNPPPAKSKGARLSDPRILSDEGKFFYHSFFFPVFLFFFYFFLFLFLFLLLSP